jgi:hypothetical protein
VKWNRKSLLRACEALIEREDFHLRLATVDPKESTAHVEYGWKRGGGVHDINVTLDPSQGGLIESLLHECLHVVLSDLIGDSFNARLEEVIIRELERELWAKAMKSPEVAHWRSLIDRKLECNSQRPTSRQPQAR